MKKHRLFIIGLSALILSFSLLSCSKETKGNSKNNSQQQQVTSADSDDNSSNSTKESTTDINNASENNSSETNNEASNTSSKPYVGTWMVKKKIATTPIYALSEDEISSYFGKKLSIEENKVSFDGENLVNPSFEESTLSDNDFNSENKVSLKTIEINSPSVKKVDVIQNANSNWTSFFGNTFYVKDSNTLIVLWDGVFFELNKV